MTEKEILAEIAVLDRVEQEDLPRQYARQRIEDLRNELRDVEDIEELSAVLWVENNAPRHIIRFIKRMYERDRK